ncbi:hypothetical protein [Aquabacterium sp. NJ1]|uniref:hypothetical protein n=1 Tax=Aquabacterium sp. NJ1 TaxID=1538295 RepID=UPI001269E866|nr:hypothetical protein [Aquabacterium sp. NJ1]
MSFAARHAVRDLHVAATTRQVIRHLRQKMRPECLQDRRMRKSRHDFYRDALTAHAENVQLFQSI